MASADIKGFFRQKKGGVSKKSSSISTKKLSKSILGASDATQAPALISHGNFDLQGEYGEVEEKLRQFDMEMKYGPCVGLTRLERWERASSMGLNPPGEIGNLLRSFSASNPMRECLWEGRV